MATSGWYQEHSAVYRHTALNRPRVEVAGLLADDDYDGDEELIALRY